MRMLTLTVILALPLCSARGAEPEGRNLIERQTADGELEGWKSFHEDPATRTGDVWQLQPDGILVCRGVPKGYLYTEKDYADVSMEFEWRWPPEGKPGNGGVLVRTTGAHRIWPKSLEVQLNNGQAGDFWGLAGFELAGSPDRMQTITHADFGKLTHVQRAKATEKPAGEWNHCEFVLEGGRIRVTINGEPVNEAHDCEVLPGKIVLTAEGAEIHFRNVRLRSGP